MSELKTNKISPAVGTGVTLGDSGDTFTIPSGATIVNSGTATGFGGQARNFIIDGDFTQWPEGDKTGIASTNYGPALFNNIHSGGEVVHDVKKTVSNGYNFMHVDITTAETAVGAGDYLIQEYRITGSDFLDIHEQTVTIQFTHNHTKTGTYCVGLRNSANNRSYVFEYTQSVTNTEEVHTETITLDQSGTWLFTEADVGLRLMFIVMAGSTFQTTADTWTAGNYFATSNQVAGADSASNNFKIGKVGLYLGSTAPTFTSEPIATVQDQVAYYFRKVGGDVSTQYSYTAAVLTTSVGAGFAMFDPPMRAAPTCAFFGTNTNFRMYLNAATTASNGDPTFDGISKAGVRVMLATAASMTTGQAGAIVHQTTSEYFTFDARH